MVTWLGRAQGAALALQRPFGEVPAAAAQHTRRGVLQLADPCPRGVSDALRLRPAHCNGAPLLDEALGEAANALAKVRELGLQLIHGRGLKEIRDSNAESREQHLYVTVDSIADVPSLLGLDGGAERLRRDQ